MVHCNMTQLIRSGLLSETMERFHIKSRFIMQFRVLEKSVSQLQDFSCGKKKKYIEAYAYMLF